MRARTWMTGAAVAAMAIAAVPRADAHGNKHHKQASEQSQLQQGTGGSGEAVQMKTLTPEQLQWAPAPPGLPQGARATVLSGNPAQKGTFVMRLEPQQDNYQIKPHTHPTDEYLTVIQGTFHAGMGGQFDKAKAKEFPQGSFIVMPANQAHYAWADKGTVIQVQGRGPFVIKYVNPADDPRRQGVGGAGQAGQPASQASQGNQNPSHK